MCQPWWSPRPSPPTSDTNGGAINVAGASAKLVFSGNAVVYDNPRHDSETNDAPFVIVHGTSGSSTTFKLMNLILDGEGVATVDDSTETSQTGVVKGGCALHAFYTTVEVENVVVQNFEAPNGGAIMSSGPKDPCRNYSYIMLV